VGTLSEVVDASNAARAELLPFIATELPSTIGLGDSFAFGLATFNLRHLFKLFPFLKRCTKPFTREMINLGGLERVQLLITIARFDIDGDGEIDDQEFEISRKEGEKAVSNAIAGCQNFAIVSALLFGATHLANIGRPVPFKADQASVDALGKTETDVVLWVIYVLNVLAETLALSIMITSIFIRQLVSNALPSVISKLAFLSDTNILSNMATLVTWMLACIVWVVTLGGFPAVPTHGFASAAVFPLLFILVVPSVYPAFLKTAVRLHLEAQAMLAGNTTVILKKHAANDKSAHAANGKSADMSAGSDSADLENENEEVVAVCAC
jgi:hypothetical protein